MTQLLRDSLSSIGRRGESTFHLTTTFRDLNALRPEWEALVVGAQRGDFAHPAWLIAWAEEYVAEDDLRIVSVRENGELVGVAPLYHVRRPALPEPLASMVPRPRVLRLLGMGRGNDITELAEIVTVPDASPVVRLIVQGLLELEDWDWLELTLTPEQGWFESEWIDPVDARPRAVAVHRATRACVVVPLASSWELQRLGLGRNVRESIRRGHNRLRRAGHEWRVVDEYASPEEIDVSVDHLIRLHRARAASDRGPTHLDQLSDEAARRFLRRAVRGLAADGFATAALMEIDGDVCAAKLLLHGGRSTFFSLSGFDPHWWDYGIGTTLMTELLQRRIARGDVIANLSLSPDRPKLRWSRQLRLYQDFAIVRSGRRARLAFRAFRVAQAALAGRG